MRKILTLLSVLTSFLFFVFIQSCKEEQNPTEPTERPVYEGSGSVGATGAIIKITNQSSPIKGAYIDIPQGALSGNVTISISQAPSDIKAPTDTTALVIQFEPKGLQFNSAVKIGLPYNPSNHDVNKLKAFYYNPESEMVTELGVESINTAENVVITYTDHFSKFYSGSSNVGAEVEMFKINNKFAAKVRIFGDYQGNLTNTVFGIPTILPMGLIYPNMGVALQDYFNYDAIVALHVVLYEQVLGSIATERARCDMYFHRVDYFGPEQQVDILKYNISNGSSQFLYNHPPDVNSSIYTPQDIDTWYSGKTLIFRFDDFSPNTSKNYYIGVTFAMSNEPSLTSLARITQLYGLNNYSEKKKIADVGTFNDDVNNDFIDDRYQTQTQNQPPSQPSNPVPANNATNQSINTDLSWTCTDPENDPITYDIYFGTATNPPLVKSNHTSTTYDLSTLQYNTIYYWKIVAKDDYGNSTTGTVWKFTTASQTVNQPPSQPSNPIPANNATGQSIDVDISWSCSDPENDPLTYDIYFGTYGNPPLVKSNHTSTTYDPGTLQNNTSYYWKIVAKDNQGNSATGTVWKFTTALQTVNQPPAQPSNPIPSNNATNQSINTDISWECSDPENDPMTYDIYFGTSSNPPLMTSNQTLTNYDPGLLEYLTAYYWKIVAKDDHGNSTTGPVWNFTTAEAVVMNIPCPGLPTITDPRDGKIYNTVLIGEQCWLKENMDIGTRIDGILEQTDNTIIEKYCYDDDTNNCTVYGGLYLWDEAMQYVTNEEAQGICPEGWHIPTYSEFMMLYNAVGGDGNAIKREDQGSGNGQGTNTSGYSALLSGTQPYGDDPLYWGLNEAGYIWASTEYELYFKFSLIISGIENIIQVDWHHKEDGSSVRCLKD